MALGRLPYLIYSTGLIKPSYGSILVDDLNLEQIEPDWWRNQLLAVGQEPEFLEDTIRNNLANTVEQVTDEDMTKALSLAGLISFIDQSKDGFGHYRWVKSNQI